LVFKESVKTINRECLFILCYRVFFGKSKKQDETFILYGLNEFVAVFHRFKSRKLTTTEQDNYFNRMAPGRNWRNGDANC